MKQGIFLRLSGPSAEGESAGLPWLARTTSARERHRAVGSCFRRNDGLGDHIVPAKAGNQEIHCRHDVWLTNAIWLLAFARMTKGRQNALILLGRKRLEQKPFSLCGFFDHFPADVGPAHEIVAGLAFQDRFSNWVVGCN